MAKKVTALIKLQVNAGKATPAPPIGPALGQHGINIPGFCKEFNARTANQVGLVIPVVITVYQDRTFTFITKTPPAAVLIKKAAGHGACVPASPNTRTRWARSPRPRFAEIAETQDARPQRRLHRGRDEHGGRHGALDGRCRLWTKPSPTTSQDTQWRKDYNRPPTPLGRM